MGEPNQSAEQERPNTWVWGFLAVAWACILLMGYSLGLHERFLRNDETSGTKAPATAPNQTMSASGASDSGKPVHRPVCDAAPPVGKLVVQYTRPSTTPTMRASLDIDNQHYFPLLLRFSNISAGGAGKVVYIDKQVRDRLDIPAGNYRLLVEVGQEWCSIAHGFSDGHALRYHDSVTVGEGSTSTLRIVPLGVEPDELLVSFTGGGLDLPAGTGKTMELSRQMDGHFHVRAEVNKYPVTFMVDTGATKTTIPYQMATELGLDRKCKSVRFNTAAGDIQGCIAIAAELKFGDFSLRQIEVAFNKANNMPLLGMNVLSQFRMQQLGNTLIISN